MVVNYKNLGLINFPIYGLNSSDVYVEDGVLRDGGLVIDDRNQIGDNIGVRRLQTPHKLLPLRRMHEDIGALINSRYKVFVDYKGYVFIYEKTKFCTVSYQKIKEIIYRDVCCYLKIAKIPFPVEVKRPPPKGKIWVGMLYVDKHPWIPYDYSDKYLPSKKRKI